MSSSQSQNSATPRPIGLGVPRVGQADAPADLPPAGPDGQRLLRDRFGRIARDLRVSLTDRCNLRCTYCMPEEGLDWIASKHLLSDAETIRLITLAVTKLGIEQVRFTGGEPLLRKALEEIVAATTALRTHEGKTPATALTTNALGLDKRAQKLADAGLQRINISLDTINHERFATLTRRDRLDDVFAGIDAAKDAGLEPIKVNAVVMPGVNEDDMLPLAHFCVDNGLQLRFIEQMPLGPRDQWDRQDMVTARQILGVLTQDMSVKPSPKPRGSAPAELFDVTTPAGSTGTIGVIASVTEPFCGDCDRTRLTADGAVRNCLFGNSETQLRDLLRSGANDDELATAWAGEMWVKKPGHGIDDKGFLQPARPMSAIGG